MRKVIGVLFFTVFLTQIFNQVLIVAQYFAQKDYIAKNLCENRSKPQMHCEGKCCLKKQLAKTGKEHAPNSNNSKQQETVILFCSNNEVTVPELFSENKNLEFFCINNNKTIAGHHSIFHPPSFSV